MNVYDRFLIAFGFLAVGTRLTWLIASFLLLLIVGIADHAIPRQAVRRITVTREAPSRAFWGDVVTVRVRLHNDGWLPVPWVDVLDPVPGALRVALDRTPRRVGALEAGGAATLEYVLNYKRRGEHRLGPMVATTGGLIAAADRRLGGAADQRLVVYPRIVPLGRLGLRTSAPFASLAATSSLLADPTRIRGVRDYRPGDPHRDIHWRATAATGRLVVKQREPAVARNTLVCLDLDRPAYQQRRRHDTVELAIVVAASLATHIASVEGQEVGMVARGLDRGTRTELDVRVSAGAGDGPLMEVLEGLARIGLRRDELFPAVLGSAADGLAWGSSITVITPGARLAVVEAIADLVGRGRPVDLVLIRPDPDDEAHLAALAALGVRHSSGVERSRCGGSLMDPQRFSAARLVVMSTLVLSLVAPFSGLIGDPTVGWVVLATSAMAVVVSDTTWRHLVDVPGPVRRNARIVEVAGLVVGSRFALLAVSDDPIAEIARWPRGLLSGEGVVVAAIMAAAWAMSRVASSDVVYGWGKYS